MFKEYSVRCVGFGHSLYKYPSLYIVVIVIQVGCGNCEANGPRNHGRVYPYPAHMIMPFVGLCTNFVSQDVSMCDPLQPGAQDITVSSAAMKWLSLEEISEFASWEKHGKPI